MRCKTEQEEAGCLPESPAQAGEVLRVIVAVRKDCPARKVRAKTNDRPRSLRKWRTGQNPAYSHQQTGVFRQRSIPVLIFIFL